MKVLLFARARDIVGADAIDIETPATIGELRRLLARTHPALAALLAKSALAVNGEFARDDAALASGDTVALLPPVSGG
jgi:molybdopterin converting factor subunit 1